jgi:hypothetical protein
MRGRFSSPPNGASVFFRRKKAIGEALAAVEECREQIRSVRTDLEEFKRITESRIDGLRKEVDGLAAVSHNIDSRPPASNPDADSQYDQNRTAAVLDDLRQDLAFLKRGLMDLLTWADTTDPAFKTLHTALEDVRKDIRNRITYAISRLKT